MRNRKSIILVCICIICFALSFEKCTLGDCTSYIEQKWFLGDFEAELTTNKQIVNVGDTIKFILKIDKNLIDINNKPINIDKGIKILNRFSLNENTGVLAGKSLFENFEDYFDYKVLKGIPESVFSYNCELTNEKWEVEIQYIPKKKGEYIIYLKISEIITSDLNLGYKECMLGDPNFGARVIWKENQFNRIKDLQPNDYLDNEFGIIVE